MDNLIITVQIIVSVLLIAAVLIQTKGTGFGKAWGGSTSFTRRGLERLIFRATFVVGF